MLQISFEQLFEYVAQHIPSEQVMMAKIEYQKMTGETYEDDKSYNMRMALFLEWYLLDYYAPGKNITPLEAMIEENPTSWVQGSLEVYKSISNNIQALYEVKKIRENTVTVLDLFTDEKYQVYEEDSKLVFRKNDVFQGRIVYHQGKYFFTGYYSFHPTKTQRYIKSEAKKIYLTHRVWKKELNQLEKKLAKFQKSYLKISQSIEKIKSKIYNTDIEERLDRLNKEISILESDSTQTAVSSQEIEQEIVHLKHDKFKIEGRRLISDLIIN
jgi:hypothetical protein